MMSRRMLSPSVPGGLRCGSPHTKGLPVVPTFAGGLPILGLILLALLGWVASAVAAPPVENGFSEGNRLYSAGQFAPAVGAYERAVREGSYTANLFFNLGNAYYRTGDRGRAILNYQRALVLEPGHTEAAANLAFVRGRSPAENTGYPPGAMAELRATLAGPGVDAYTWLAAVSGWLGILCGGLGIFRPRARLLLSALAACAVFICAVSIGVIVLLDGGLKSAGRALVLADGAAARYAPADSAKAIVRLPVGSEVHILSAQGPWEYVRLADGTRGWMATSGIGAIDPSGGR